MAQKSSQIPDVTARLPLRCRLVSQDGWEDVHFVTAEHDDGGVACGDKIMTPEDENLDADVNAAKIGYQLALLAKCGDHSDEA